MWEHSHLWLAWGPRGGGDREQLGRQPGVMGGKQEGWTPTPSPGAWHSWRGSLFTNLACCCWTWAVLLGRLHYAFLAQQGTGSETRDSTWRRTDDFGCRLPLELLPECVHHMGIFRISLCHSSPFLFSLWSWFQIGSLFSLCFFLKPTFFVTFQIKLPTSLRLSRSVWWMNQSLELLWQRTQGSDSLPCVHVGRLFLCFSVSTTSCGWASTWDLDKPMHAWAEVIWGGLPRTICHGLNPWADCSLPNPRLMGIRGITFWSRFYLVHVPFMQLTSSHS